jgi:hypothetical protein
LDDSEWAVAWPNAAEAIRADSGGRLKTDLPQGNGATFSVQPTSTSLVTSNSSPASMAAWVTNCFV